MQSVSPSKTSSLGWAWALLLHHRRHIMQYVSRSAVNAVRGSKIHKIPISSQNSGLHFAFNFLQCESLTWWIAKCHSSSKLPMPVVNKMKCEMKTSLFKTHCNLRKVVLGWKPEFLRASLPKTVANISTRHHCHYWVRLYVLLPGKWTQVSKVTYLSQFPLHAKLKFLITRSETPALIHRLRT